VRQIVIHAGEDAAVVLNRVKDEKDAFGYNAATGEYPKEKVHSNASPADLEM